MITQKDILDSAIDSLKGNYYVYTYCELYGIDYQKLIKEKNNINKSFNINKSLDFKEITIFKIKQRINTNWTSPNKLWKIYFNEHRQLLIIENVKSGFIEIPHTYSMGKICFYEPSKIPKYIRDKYIKIVS